MLARVHLLLLAVSISLSCGEKNSTPTTPSRTKSSKDAGTLEQAAPRAATPQAPGEDPTGQAATSATTGGEPSQANNPASSGTNGGANGTGVEPGSTATPLPGTPQTLPSGGCGMPASARADCKQVSLAAAASAVLKIIDSAEAINQFDANILLTQTPESTWVQSSVYRWRDFLEAYRTITSEGVDGRVFYPGQSLEAGLINIAIFLGQSMHETIQYDACDENNWSQDLYPASAACGQANQDYTAYVCGAAEKHMQCPIDRQMVQKAATHAKWWGAPPPLFCAPKSLTGDKLPRWNTAAACSAGGSVPADIAGWVNANIKQLGNASCQAYVGQKGGSFTSCGAAGCANATVVDTAGGSVHTDVEGCCWWGRGVIQTTGVCNFGKLNYYLAGWEYADNGNGTRTKRRHDANAKYAKLNFCEDPSLLCQGPKELKWIAGMFYWIDSVQGYKNASFANFDYMKNLERDASAIFNNPDGAEARLLVDQASGLVNRGCPAATCPGSGPVHEGEKRFSNFKKVMSVLKALRARG